MGVELLAFIALCTVAGAAATTALLNVGAERRVAVGELDLPPQVVSMPQVIVVSVSLGLVTAVALGVFVSPALAVLGIGLGLVVALGWRGARLGRWTKDITRDTQTLAAVLIIQLQSGGDSLYRAIEAAATRANLTRLGPILDRHVLARVAAGTTLDQALADLARCRLLQDAPIAQDALARLADLAAREAPVDNMLDALRIMDGTMTEIVRLEEVQAAASAQTRYSTYLVALLEVGMGAAVIFMARDLGALLLHTLPGNITLVAVCAAVAIAIFAVERLSTSRPLRF